MVDGSLAGSGPAPSPVSGQIRLVSAVFIAAVLLLAGLATLAYYSSYRNTGDAHWVDHTYEVIIITDQVLSGLRGAVATARGYMISADPRLRRRYDGYASSVLLNIGALEKLIGDNPEQCARVASLHRLAEAELRGLAQMVAGQRPGARMADQAMVEPVLDTARNMDQLESVTRELVAEEDRLLAQRRARAATGQERTIGIIVVGDLASLLALLACLWLLIREIAYRRHAAQQVKALNGELAARNAQLEASNRELEGFSYSISHDLRSPLRAIDGYSKLLVNRSSAVLDDEARRLLGLVNDNTRRMAALIDDLLAFSRLGRKALELEELDMTAMAAQCVAEVLQVSGQRPRVMVAPLPSCHGDRTLMRQVWMNLIANAVKYSQRNPGARVDIRGQLQDGECLYSVTDNGVGFDMQYYHKLFGVFQRLHAVEEFPGTGVGLAIAMRIVTKHGGRIWADASVGQGATFFFTVPRMENA